MRGRAQAHLVQADDGRCYVVKFRDNPQGCRTLVNEFVSSLLLRELGIYASQPSYVRIDDQFLRNNPDVFIACGGTKLPVQPGLHYGSWHPGGVSGAISIYDFFPDPLAAEIHNRDHFFGVLVADKWLSNADGRQAVFFRRAVLPPGESDTSTAAWVAMMIDHGHAFQGPDWTFRDSAIQGIYCRRVVYGDHPTMRDFSPWLERLMELRRDVLDAAYAGLPPDWIAGEELEFARVLQRLDGRRALVPQLVAASVDGMHRQEPASHSVPSG